MLQTGSLRLRGVQFGRFVEITNTRYKVPFVSVVPIIVPLCSIYLWCNQNVFKRILHWTNTIYSGRFNISTTNCSLGIFAKSLDGLSRAWVRIPPTPPILNIKLSRFFLKAFLLFVFCFQGVQFHFTMNLFFKISAMVVPLIFYFL